MGFAANVAENLIANVIFWVALGLFFWVAANVVQRRLITFFGLAKASGIGIVLSNLYLPGPDSLAADPKVSGVTESAAVEPGTFTDLADRGVGVATVGLHHQSADDLLGYGPPAVLVRVDACPREGRAVARGGNHVVDGIGDWFGCGE